jgi:cytosine/adenosine deaminase-related metal-dependent hydrolase
MIDLRIDNGIVITVDGARRVIADGSVAIHKDRIVAVGPTKTLSRTHPARRTIDARRKAVIPGLIDAHAHAGHGLIKTMGGGRGDLWYEACHKVYTTASPESFWRAEAQLAALERLRFGVTTGVSLLGGGDSVMRTDEPSYCDAHCDGVREVGTRSVVAIGPTRPPHPRLYARVDGKRRKTRMVSFEDQLETCRTLIDSWHGTHGRRLNIAMLTPTLRAEHRASMAATDFDEAIRQAKAARALSRERGTIFTQDGHQRGSVAFAHRTGLLGPDALLSHSTDLTKAEIALCAKTETRIAHNPSAIASVYGRCPAPELIDAGVVVALGSDGTAPDRSGDMFRHMQQCMHYHRRHFRDASLMPPGKILEMATIDAARALGMADDLGSLEVGKKADVVLVDLARPHLYPFNMPVFRLVCFANGADVDTVIVDGRILLSGGKPKSVKTEKVLDAAQRETEAMLDRAGLRKLIQEPAGIWNATRYDTGRV